MRPLLLSTAAIALLYTGAAHATPVPSAASILQDFNAVIYTNASTTSDIEGAAVIGGNFSGATVYNNPTDGGASGGTQPFGFGALTVFGSTSGNTINIDDRGNAYVGGTEGAHISFNGGKYIVAPPFGISAFETVLNGLSTSLSQTAPNSALPTLSTNQPNNNIVFRAMPGANGVAVFDITAAQLDSISSYSINMNGSSSVIFNVSGNATFAANEQNATASAHDVIWNFYNATSVALNTQIGGTVLAPDATVSNGNQIDGFLAADAWTGNGELHDYAFTGTLPADPVPEPDTLAVLGIGMLGLAFVAHRKTIV